jgi:phage-related protein
MKGDDFMDGWITIGTKLDSKQLEKDLNTAKRELQKYEKEAERLTEKKAKAEVDLSPYEEQKRLIREVTDETLTQAQTEKEVESVLNTEKIQLEQLNEKYSKQINNLNDIKSKINENTLNQEKTKSKIEEINNKLNKTKINFKSIDGITKAVGGSMSNVAKKVATWGIALLGIRTAYGFIRNIINTLSQYNEKLAVNLEYIRFALASSLQPVVERIIQLVFRLLTYINYIAKAWFGVDLFANASANAFNKNSKAIGSAAKNAKELNKQLAGFDEMNVLQDNSSSSTGSGGGVGGGAVPSIDLSTWQGDVPEWVKWIADNKDVIIAGLLGIAGALIALKAGLMPIKALGIGVAIAGIVYAIQSLMEYLKNPTWKNFGKVIQGIGIAIIGIGIAIESVPAIVIGAIVLIVGTIIKYWDQIKAFLQKGIDWFIGKSDWVHNAFGNVIGDMYDNFTNTLQNILDWSDKIIKGMKANFDEIIKFVKNVFAGNWKGAWENVKNIFSNIWSAMKNTAKMAFNAFLNLGKNIASGVGNAIASVFKAVVNGVLLNIERILNTPIKTINSLINTVNAIPGVNLKKLPTFKLPRLARGGIVNNPGPGVMMGNYIAGERGPEAVLPLNDETLDKLGEAIARHQNINATIPVYVGNRQIVREIRKIESENAFAFNS